MRNPIRNETSLVLVVAVIFSGVAIPVLSGFLEPSQPPAVAAVQIGDPRDGASRDDGAPAAEPQSRKIRPASNRIERGEPAKSRARERPAPAPAPPAPPPDDDLAEDDDDGEAD